MYRDYMPRLRSLDEHDPNWMVQPSKKSGIKIILIVLILLIAIGAVIKKATAENIKPIDCMSLVYKNGEE